MSSIFLSHSTADKAFVRRLAHALRQAGAHVWLDEADLRVGDFAFDGISGGIRTMRYVGIVLSPRSVASWWVKQELAAALHREMREDTAIVLPILLEDAEIPMFLAGRVYADFRTSEKAAGGFRQLCEMLGLSAGGVEWDAPGPPALPEPPYTGAGRPADPPALPARSRPDDPPSGGPAALRPAEPPAAALSDRTSRRAVSPAPAPGAVRQAPARVTQPDHGPRVAEQLLRVLHVGERVQGFHYKPASTLPIVERSRRICRVPAAEQVLAVLDLQGWNFWIPPSQLAVFTDHGVYVSTERGLASIAYRDLVGSTINVTERAEDHVRHFARYFDMSIGPHRISVRADERGALLRKLLEQLS